MKKREERPRKSTPAPKKSSNDRNSKRGSTEKKTIRSTEKKTRGASVKKLSHKLNQNHIKKCFVQTKSEKSKEKHNLNKGILQSIVKMLRQEEQHQNTWAPKLAEIIDRAILDPTLKEKNILSIPQFFNWKEAVTHLTEKVTRSKANDLLKSKKSRKKLFQNIPQWENYEKYRNEELFHCFFVRKCMNVIPLNAPKNLHDHSKDDLYFFITICHYSLNTPVEKIAQYTKEHWKCESHHPEYEAFHPEKVTEMDIIEMCIDRLARNLQFNEGRYNDLQLKVHEPQFTCDQEIRIKIYNERMENLKPIVNKMWKEERKEELLAKLSDLVWEKVRNTPYLLDQNQ